MTIRIVYSSLARRDTLDILRVIADEAGGAAAGKYAQKFEEIFDRLVAHPEAYPSRPSLGAGIRLAAAWPYVILYRYDQSSRTATILRLLHGRRDINADFMKMR